KNTPTGMDDRIPLRADTEFQVTVKPALNNKKIYDWIEGRSEKNGDVDFKGGGGRLFTRLASEKAGTYTIRLVGARQTEPGNAKKLYYTILDAALNPLVKSVGFSVATIPSALKFSKPSKIDALNVGPPGGAFNFQWGAGWYIDAI